MGPRFQVYRTVTIKAVGRWYIGDPVYGGLGISAARRPSRIQRYLMRTLLGILWVDDLHEYKTLAHPSR